MAIDLSTIVGGLGGALSGLLGGGGALGAVGGGLAGLTGAKKGGGLTGGQVVGRGRGLILIKSPSGSIVAVKTQRHRRYAPRSRGTSMDKMMQLAMIKSLVK